MSDFTPRANLRLPGGGSTGTILPDEQVDIDVLNDNFRKIDALLGARNIPSASSYSGSMDGDLVYARDTEFLHMFSANAGGLITPRLPGARQYSGTAAERVAFAVQAKNGDLWRDTDNIGVIWVYKAGSPGTWEYTGNPLRGDRTAMDKLVTDGMAVEGMTVFNTTDNNDYVMRSGSWYKAFIISTASYSGASVPGPRMFVQTGIAGARPGALAKIEWSTFGIFNASSATIVNSSVMVSTNGLPPTASSQILVPLRAYTPAAGSVNSNPGGVTAFTVPATGNINAGLYITNSMLYGADGGTITVSVHN